MNLKIRWDFKTQVEFKLKYEDYKNVLCNRSYMRLEMNIIQSKDHNVTAYCVMKSN